ncbi:helix-turn-helix domain-containing protein [Kitasatospora viridis]|uniref:Regulatory LuxR family protein n=1 Tax=Kitasatospora viridis TaxID=281105 RepID=A0A561T7B1_9ACTN|nr:helix-turn-helix transcriptional regulator [Kitasatospora viridis]TWF82992.1 regulatory LuxR family protein [Kitasatospora viridis]
MSNDAHEGRIRTLRTPEELSAHEIRIARLVAAGSSNRRVGEILGVSTRAVEHQLTRVYRKLWISGRDQLHLALGPEPDSWAG